MISASKPAVLRSLFDEEEPVPAGGCSAGEDKDPAEKWAARVFHFGGTFSLPPGLMWLMRSENASFSPIQGEYIAFVEDRDQPYDVVVVVGEDPVRMRRFIQGYAPLFTNKVKIAAMSKTRPASRASVMNAGFEDVVDDKMGTPEVVARIRASRRRIQSRTGGQS